ncbi:MAG: hypothetical protein AAF542_17895 [Pseudomonadota bacterium]
MFTATKTDDEILIYVINWAAPTTNVAGDVGWLQGDELESTVWDVPTGITKVSDSRSTTKTTIKLSGGVVGKTYKLHNKVTTLSSDETAERCLHVTIVACK